ncbi:hypothetical protein BYT27DRAFT_7248752 [Phlegmacium glaucopus]|nr:hypothetical protein BYT27DRAFT_7248752 [Phlegmacium glaucopus]
MPGGLSKDTLICIALLSALSDGHEHLHAIIQHDLQNATADKPFLPHHIASYIASDTQLLLGDANCVDTPLGSSAITLVTRPAPQSQEPVICSNCKKKHHTKPYSHQLDKAGRVASAPTPKHKVWVTMATRQALIIEIDEDTLASGMSATPTNKFAGVIQTTDDLEWDSFIHMASQPVDFEKITVVALNQKSQTLLSLTKFPFYVDSGASIYVTPDRSDFYTLQKIEPL